jgi:hypothetical protein
VAFSAVNFEQNIANAIHSKDLHYGDPPRHDGDPTALHRCLAGATMNSEPRRVLEYWHRHDRRYVEGNRIINSKAWSEWVRDPSLEVDIQPDWVEVR